MAQILSLGGCDAYVPAHEHEARVELADYNGYLRTTASMRQREVRDVGTVKVGRLKQGQEATILLDVTGAHDATILAACDLQCSDLDLRLVTADGRLIDLDEDEDSIPRVSVAARKPEKLQLKVRMKSCATSRCTFAVSQFEYDDYKGATGTCFAVSPGGLLMTSYHVVDDGSEMTIAFPDGRKGKATLLRRSEDNDLALLQTSVPTPVWLPLATADDIKVGMDAFTVGFPEPDKLGSEAKYTEGNVSSLTGYEGEPTLLQVSIPIQGGNSGGPVVSYSGRVLGVVEASLEEDSEGSPMQFTNFARNARVAVPMSAAWISTNTPDPSVGWRRIEVWACCQSWALDGRNAVHYGVSPVIHRNRPWRPSASANCAMKEVRSWNGSHAAKRSR